MLNYITDSFFVTKIVIFSSVIDWIIKKLNVLGTFDAFILLSQPTAVLFIILNVKIKQTMSLYPPLPP